MHKSCCWRPTMNSIFELHFQGDDQGLRLRDWAGIRGRISIEPGLSTLQYLITETVHQVAELHLSFQLALRSKGSHVLWVTCVENMAFSRKASLTLNIFRIWCMLGLANRNFFFISCIVRKQNKAKQRKKMWKTAWQVKPDCNSECFRYAGLFSNYSDTTVPVSSAI